jgi:hypothetical protein
MLKGQFCKIFLYFQFKHENEILLLNSSLFGNSLTNYNYAFAPQLRIAMDSNPGPI